MKTVGTRTLPQPEARPSAERLRKASMINDPLAALLPGGRTAVPKGVYRYRTLDEGDQQLKRWIAQAMAAARAARRG